MPWTGRDAKSHTKAARNPKLAREWAHVANSMLKKHGDDAMAIRAANAVIKRAVVKRAKK